MKNPIALDDLQCDGVFGVQEVRSNDFHKAS